MVHKYIFLLLSVQLLLVHLPYVKKQGNSRTIMCLAHLRAFIQQSSSALKQAGGWRIMDAIAKNSLWLETYQP